MTQKGFSVLNDVIEKGYAHLISKVIIGKDSNLKDDYSTRIENLCVRNNLVYHFRKDRVEINTRYALAISWRWLIRLDETCRLIVIHDSLLPKYRGFAPLVNQLIRGEKKIGVTGLLASEEYDNGDIIAQRSIEVNYPLKIQKAIELIIPLYSSIACSILEQIENHEHLKATPQIEQDASYSLWRDAGDYCINWHDSAENIQRFIDAVGYPYSGAAALMNGERVRILEAEVERDVIVEIRQVGKIIFLKDNFPVIVCGSGLLKITSLQDDSGNSLLPLQKFRLRFS